MSGFMLCHDIMEMVGKEVVKKREQDTLDYWIDLDFRGGNGMRASGTLDTLKEYGGRGKHNCHNPWRVWGCVSFIDYLGWYYELERLNFREDEEAQDEGEDWEDWYIGTMTLAFRKGNACRKARERLAEDDY